MAETLGDWTLKFTVDSKGLSEATSGVQNLESSMQEAAHKSNGLAKELKGIKSDVSGLGKNFMLLGAAAGGALGGLAAWAPSLAGEFADMKIAMMGLGDALAPHIKPILDGITNSLIGLAQWVNENPEAAKWMVDIMAALGALGAASMVFKLGAGIYEMLSAGLTFGPGVLTSLKNTIVGAFTGSTVGQGIAAAIGSAAGGTGVLGGLSAVGVGATGGAVGAGGLAAGIGLLTLLAPIALAIASAYILEPVIAEHYKKMGVTEETQAEFKELAPLGAPSAALYGLQIKKDREAQEASNITSYSRQATTELGMSPREKQNQIIINVLGSLVTENELLDKVSEGLQRIGVQYG